MTMKGHIRQRSKGSWAIILDLGRDADGKRKQKWHTVRGTKKDAQRELAKLLHQLHTGEYVEPTQMTIADYLKTWLRDYAKVNVAGKTYERYAEIIERHLIPALGHHALPKLQPLHVQGYYSQALQSGRLNGRGGLSAQTVMHHHRVLREALQQAVKWQNLGRNVADAVEPPRPVHKEMRALDEAETARLLQAAQGARMYTPILMAVTTGLRRGELLALRWQDVDLDAGILAVRQSLEQTRSGLRFKAPKTQKGRRAVALPSITVEGLRRHRAEQNKERLLLGPGYADQGLVFAMADGAPWEPDAFTDAYRVIARRSGLPKVRLHDLRHTHATQLLRQGIHPKVVSERLGHATVAITLDTYSHVLPGMQEDAALRIDAAMRAAIMKPL